MQKFFVDVAAFENKTLTGDVFFQIKNVLRYQKKDQFLLGVNEKTWLVAIQEITSKEVFFEVLEEKKEEKELPVKVDVFQGYPKGDKLEDIIKYGTQLGIHSLTPVIMART
ncbi:MAG: RsmE family RNA methyltransferase, partial [Anaeroplasmataceae bacterium]|nr:RsmE family RNA methyltransferase [Anaeroplasmataceae bacterium]